LIEQNVARPNLIYDYPQEQDLEGEGSRASEGERSTGSVQNEYFIFSLSSYKKYLQTPKKQQQLQVGLAFAVVNNLQSKLLIKLSNIIFMVSVMGSSGHLLRLQVKLV